MLFCCVAVAATTAEVVAVHVNAFFPGKGLYLATAAPLCSGVGGSYERVLLVPKNEHRVSISRGSNAK